MHVQRRIWYDLEVSICLAHSMAHSMLPDVTMSQWFDCQAPRAPAPSLPRLVTASAPQHVTEQPGKDQDISGTPQNTWGGRMMEDATNGEGISYGWWFDVDYGVQKPGLIYPNIFSLKKVKKGTHVHKCQKLTISTAGQQTPIFLNHVWCVFHAFLMVLGTRAAWWREWTRRRESHDRFLLWTDAFFAVELEVQGRFRWADLMCWGWIIWTPIQVTPRVLLLQIQHGPWSSWLVPEKRSDFQPPFLVRV